MKPTVPAYIKAKELMEETGIEREVLEIAIGLPEDIQMKAFMETNKTTYIACVFAFSQMIILNHLAKGRISIKRQL